MFFTCSLAFSLAVCLFAPAIALLTYCLGLFCIRLFCFIAIFRFISSVGCYGLTLSLFCRPYQSLHYIVEKTALFGIISNRLLQAIR
jgi:hypothetical protein